ncbi:hypothetical protein IFM89_032861 [Coptis chinensis]|uniref:Bifunctional inhibitor/plant lipid transfer protein/seed storage helical domain-containing protein n=1 Tax=Coptis chinensis TaxID=261450 RepID=A0A835M7T2_9MAGN|nr:hypothetical protein IFM89_032861 [Coptis chinensis]
MAVAKFLYSSAALVLVITALAAQTMTVRAQAPAQDCPTQLTGLNSCAPFVVPGSPDTAPNAACCSALTTIDHGCLCNTLRVASRMPAACNLPALTCG